MAKRPTPDYTGLALDAQPPAPRPAEPQPGDIRRPGRPKKVRTMRDLAQPFPVYLNPKFHKALRQAALDQDRKAHDLVIEALEQWARQRGITIPVTIRAVE